MQVHLQGTKDVATITIKTKCKVARRAVVPASHMPKYNAKDPSTYSKIGLAGNPKSPLKTGRKHVRYDKLKHSLFLVNENGVVEDNNLGKGNDTVLAVDFEHAAYCNYKAFYICGDFEGIRNMMEKMTVRTPAEHAKSSEHPWKKIKDPNMKKLLSVLLSSLEQVVFNFNHFYASNGKLYNLKNHQPNLKYGTFEEYLDSTKYNIKLTLDDVVPKYYIVYGRFNGTKYVKLCLSRLCFF